MAALVISFPSTRVDHATYRKGMARQRKCNHPSITPHWPTVKIGEWNRTYDKYRTKELGNKYRGCRIRTRRELSTSPVSGYNPLRNRTCHINKTVFSLRLAVLAIVARVGVHLCLMSAFM